jgi:hypothetical protein
MLGEGYQKTNKTEDTNKLTLLVFKIIAILHNYMVGNVHKASGNSAKASLGIDHRTAVTRNAAVRQCMFCFFFQFFVFAYT